MDVRRLPNGVQAAGCRQSGHLVICKGKDVGAALQIPQKDVLAVGFALGLVGDLEIGLAGVPGLEGGENFPKEGFVLLRSPYSQLDGAATSLLAAAAGGRRLLGAAGSCQKQDPYQQKQTKDFRFHSIQPFP